MNGTHTYAALELSPAAYDEIRAKLEAAGYQHAFDDDNGAIDMQGIGVVRAEAPAIAAGKLGLPQWKCHKVVGAAKITALRKENLRLFLDIDTGAAVGVDNEWVARHQPEAGGYFVEYEDGYTSFSPADAFEKGYAPLADAPGRAPKWPLPAAPAGTAFT